MPQGEKFSLEHVADVVETLERAADRIEMNGTDGADEWLWSVARLFRAEADAFEACPDEQCEIDKCDKRRTLTPVDTGTGRKRHHHCRFCFDDAPAVEAARAYLWSH